MEVEYKTIQDLSDVEFIGDGSGYGDHYFEYEDGSGTGDGLSIDDDYHDCSGRGGDNDSYDDGSGYGK